MRGKIPYHVIAYYMTELLENQNKKNLKYRDNINIFIFVGLFSDFVYIKGLFQQLTLFILSCYLYKKKT